MAGGQLLSLYIMYVLEGPSMTGNDAKKLKRGELLELLIEQTEENQRLTKAMKKLEEQLAQRKSMDKKAIRCGALLGLALCCASNFQQFFL